MITYVDTIVAICEEFTDTILVDRANHSILTSIPKTWFDALDDKLQKLNYRLIFKHEILDSYTCTYVLVNKA